jgi:DNA-binding XRE family transcriptional regulator/tetratricopeptide (TPR) repeat protein
MTNEQVSPLAAYRLAAGFTQESLAEQLSIDRSTIGRWERGTQAPQPWQRPDLATSLRISLTELDDVLRGTLARRNGGSDTPSPVDKTCEYPDSPLREGAVLPVTVGGRQVLVPLDADTIERSGLGPLLDELATSGPPSGRSTASPAGWNQMNPLSRRCLLTQGLAALPVLGLDEARHVAAALTDARRYLDSTVVHYFRRQLDSCKAEDGTRGPAATLPTVLTIVHAVDQHARDVTPDIRRHLLRVGAQGAEFAGWLYRDVQNSTSAAFWRDRAMEWAQEAGDLAMQGYVLLKKAQAAYDERDATRMLTLAQAAQNGPWQLPAKVRADIAQQEARGHAMLGDDNAMVERKLDEAGQLLADATADEDSAGLGAHYNQTLLTMQTAICYTEAGQPWRAAQLYQQWLSVNRFSRRDYGYFLSLMASSLALAGEPDAAAATGLRSLPLAITTNSRRTTQELDNVLTLLQPWENRAAVRELRAAVRP